MGGGHSCTGHECGQVAWVAVATGLGNGQPCPTDQRPEQLPTDRSNVRLVLSTRVSPVPIRKVAAFQHSGKRWRRGETATPLGAPVDRT